MHIRKSSLDELAALRNEYLKSLPGFQELFLELMVPDSDKHLILEQDEKIGYALVTKKNTLMEFFISERYSTESFGILNRIVTLLPVNNILCKSFDHLLASCCFRSSYPYAPIGVLYRDFLDRGIVVSDELGAKRADESLAKTIMQQKDCFEELFETEDFLRSFLCRDHVFLFYRNDNLVGCGTALRTHPEWNYCDLGVWVKSEFRKQGIGAQIITFLRKFALENSFRPTCGCSIDNIASQKTLEKAGFISRHSLIEFKC